MGLRALVSPGAWEWRRAQADDGTVLGSTVMNSHIPVTNERSF